MLLRVLDVGEKVNLSTDLAEAFDKLMPISECIINFDPDHKADYYCFPIYRPITLTLDEFKTILYNNTPLYPKLDRGMWIEKVYNELKERMGM